MKEEGADEKQVSGIYSDKIYSDRGGKSCSIIWRNLLVSKGLSCNGWLGGVGSRKSSIDRPDPESKTNLKKIYKVI